MRRLVLFLVVFLLLGAATPPSGAQLQRTQPEHYGKGVGGDSGLQGRGLPDFRTPNNNSRILMRRRQDLTSIGPPDKRMTEACRKGQLRQVIEHRYVALLNEKVYGAGVGGRGMLYDPKRVAQPGLVYLFIGQGTTNCRVYMLGAAGAG